VQTILYLGHLLTCQTYFGACYTSVIAGPRGDRGNALGKVSPGSITYHICKVTLTVGKKGRSKLNDYIGLFLINKKKANKSNRDVMNLPQLLWADCNSVWSSGSSWPARQLEGWSYFSGSMSQRDSATSRGTLHLSSTLLSDQQLCLHSLEEPQ